MQSCKILFDSSEAVQGLLPKLVDKRFVWNYFCFRMKTKPKSSIRYPDLELDPMILRETATAVQKLPPSELVRSVEQGLPLAELEDLRRDLDLPMDRLAPRLGLSKATLHRRRIEGRLSSDESDKVVRFARLYGKALEIFGTEQNARLWLSTSQFGLGGQSRGITAQGVAYLLEIDHFAGG